MQVLPAAAAILSTVSRFIIIRENVAAARWLFRLV
jgi:hypothetical protein